MKKKRRLHPIEIAAKNASFDILGYIQQKFKEALKMREVECPQTELEPVPRDEMGNALMEFLNIKSTEK